MAPAVAEIEVEHLALTEPVDVVHRTRLINRPLVVDPALAFAVEAGFEQPVQVAVLPAQIELVVRFKLADALDQFMLRIGDGHLERVNGRMGEELGAQGLHQHRRSVRGIHPAVLEELQDRVGAVQRKPAFAGRDVVAQGDLLILLRH